MLCADGPTIALPLVYILITAGGIIGAAIVASWRETVAVARDLAAARVEIADLMRRIDAIDRR